MILEAIVTTMNPSREINIAPMGPHVNSALTEFTLKPFASSRTFANLQATGCAVVHTTDDVLLLAKSAINRLDEIPDVVTLDDSRFVRLADCCRWFAIEATQWTDDALRPMANCRIVSSGTVRPFFGFCRAKHAVLEAAILATRIHLLDPAFLADELKRLRVLVEKTGGDDETLSFELVETYVKRKPM